MDSSFWQSLTADHGPAPTSHSAPTKHWATTLQDLLISLACSDLWDVSTADRLYPALGAHLGTGATFSVERKESESGKIVAVKHIRRDGLPSLHYSDRNTQQAQAILDAVLVEVKVLLHLRSLAHKSIAELVAYGWDDGPLPYLVLEYADLGSLSSFLAAVPQSWEEKIRVAVSIASALELLHACDIIHGDVKLENILVFSDAENKHGFEAKLADFGFSCSESLGRRIFRGTSLFNAPEIRRHEGSSGGVAEYTKADVYSFGIALWEIAHDGQRYYSVPAIGIQLGGEEMDFASAFLARLDAEAAEIAPFALEFLEGLDHVPEGIRHTFKNALHIALARDPDKRSDICDVRTELDPTNESELEIVIPVHPAYYSIFDITTDALQWEPRRQLATSYLEGANAPDNPNRGLDAFNLAAFYSLGFGVSLDEDLAVTWLKRASSYGHAPATVLCRTYATAGLFHGFQCEDTAEDGGFWGRLRCQVLPLGSEKRFAIQFRGFYKHQNRRSAQSPISILSAQKTTRVEGEQQLLTFLEDCHNEAIHETWVTVEMDGQSITKPLMHYLVAAHPELAESMLQRGVDGSAIIEGKRLSLLHTACASGSKRLILLLLETYPELAMVITSDGVSPLHFLFMLEDNEMLEIAQALAKSTVPGIGIRQVGVGVFAEFNLIFSGPPVHWAIMARNTTAVECLLRCGADPNYESPMPQVECLRYSGFPLDVAVCMLMPELVELLIRHGAKLGSREDEVRMAIHFIGDAVDPFRLWLYHGSQVREALKATVNTLLRYGVELDAESDDGRTPLRYITTSPACTVSFLEPFLDFGPACPQDLLLWAAQSLQHDQFNSRKMALVLDFCSRNYGGDSFMDQCLCALEFLVSNGSVSAAREVFRYFDQFRLPNLIDENEYLHIAAAANHVEMMQLLLELGAALDCDAGGTAAAAAACRSSRKALDYLLRQGASVFTSPCSPESATILHEIVSEGQSLHESERTLEHVCGNDEHLLRLIAIVNNYDSRGFTALHVAITWGSLVNVARLLEMGADERCVRGTDISPTTLALLAKSHTPWLITQQGPAEVLRHQKRMDEIIAFLTQSSGFGLPRVVAGYERVVGYWTKNTRQFHIKIMEGGSSIEWCRSRIRRS